MYELITGVFMGLAWGILIGGAIARRKNRVIDLGYWDDKREEIKKGRKTE